MAGRLPDSGTGREPLRMGRGPGLRHPVLPAGPEMPTKVRFRFLEDTRCDLGSAKIS